MKFHVITGTPRSGSTLLCNILNQNPGFHVSDTSALANVLSSAQQAQNMSDEVVSDLINNKESAENRSARVYKAIIDAWYEDNSKKVVFDKGRHWTFSSLELQSVYPDAKMLIMVRDPRDIFSSVEKQHRNNPVFSQAASPNEKTLFQRANLMLSSEAFIGQPMVGVEDAIRRDHKNQMIIEYNALVSDPELVLRRIYKFIGEEDFSHDFENVEEVSGEIDALWLNKFPHNGGGKVEPQKNSWMDYIDGDTAAHIMQAYPFYNQKLGYQ